MGEIERPWKVGALARATGLTTRALHHRDDIGLLVPGRTELVLARPEPAAHVAEQPPARRPRRARERARGRRRTSSTPVSQQRERAAAQRGYKWGIESLKGQLLIAGATLPDPNFARTVVLVCEHSEDGALGLVLNRPGDLLVGEAAPELAELLGDDAIIDTGGPVQTDALLVLAEFENPAAAGIRVVENVGLVGDGSEIEDLVEETRRARVFAGYAGWGPGQLDAELEREDWFVAPAGVDDIFNPDADELWARVLARKGAHFALVARMPIDPSVN